MEGNRGMHSMDIAKGAVSSPFHTWTWVSSLLDPCVSNFTLGPSWSTASCLAFLFSIYSTSCGLHYAYVTCEGVKRQENWVWSWGKLFGAILFFGTFFDVSENHLNCEMGRVSGKWCESCGTFPEELRSCLSFSSAQEVAEKAEKVGTSMSLHCEKDVSCFILMVIWVRIPGTTSKIQMWTWLKWA